KRIRIRSHERQEQAQTITQPSRHALRALPVIAREAGRRMKELTISTPSGDERLAVFTEGDELYADMLRHVQAARRSVRLECYIFGNDGIGREFVEALAERAQAGVRVQLHLDAFGSFPFGMS